MYGPMDAYLIEARSIRRAQWFALFVDPGFTRPTGGMLGGRPDPPFFLLGLVHGHWDSTDYDDGGDDRTSDDFTLKGRESVNMGIAIVVRVQKIIDLFALPGVRESEERILKKWQEENLPVAD